MTRLIADIGGTNARFALAEPGGTPAEERHLLVRDFPLIQGIVLIWSAIIIFLNLLVDLAYGVLDPRIRV